MHSVLATLASAIATTQVLAASNDAATPEDVLNSMKDLDKLSADTRSHAKKLDTYLSCRATIEGVGKINDELKPNSRRHSTIKAKRRFAQRFTVYLKGGITSCEYSHWTCVIRQFEHLQFLLVVTLINEPRSIESGGFDGYFEDYFTRLKPALTGFIRRLADYAPSCRDKIVKNNGQLKRAFDDAIKKIKHRWGGRRAIPVDIPVPLD
ncbi:hypothetical protein NCS57_00192600 [Fusarium keratoplasticum]|uniref:Uncharacterized protein n=1 Tax=Fusarium keratoplasticum TaxID=1328300 RepID=A0ACC0R8M7_9HYPO|nr:hypothetical protein NCS57_00192600 [Fusarium keratoplasticum]KAI8679158.1 hypothetical protein NCS57_00192600 [Fusarium keratoplasticum]